MRDKRTLIKGILIILCAAFVWGIGNAVTGLTAYSYLSSGSLFPAVDIALANTLGGLFFLIVVYLIRSVIFDSSALRKDNQNSFRLCFHFLNRKSFLSGAMKGANTCFFVFSTTYIPATESLIFESTYIIWSLVLSFFFFMRKVSFIPTALKALVFFFGVILVSGQTSIQLDHYQTKPGLIFGICAGLSYSFYLFFWSFITKNLNNIKSQLISTSFLLIISFLTIIFFTEIISASLMKTWWIPFTHLKYSDIILQFFNGTFVIGLTYLLITIGMTLLKNVREGASYIVALCLSFSVPFTLLPEIVFGKVVPTGLQVFGIFVFMLGFVLMSLSLLKTQQNLEEDEIND